MIDNTLNWFLESKLIFDVGRNTRFASSGLLESHIPQIMKVLTHKRGLVVIFLPGLFGPDIRDLGLKGSNLFFSFLNLVINLKIFLVFLA